MRATEGYFSHDDGVFEPLPTASSGWHPKQLRGPAVTGLLARAAEQACPAQDRQPARATFELFRPALMTASTMRATVVRSGRRLTLVDSEMVQGGVVVARAHVLFLALSENPEGRLWAADGHPDPPPAGVRSDEEGRVYQSHGGAWTPEPADHYNEHAKAVWQEPLTIVHGEPPTPFQCVASTSDLTSLVVHWGDRGVEYINADVSVALSRLPIGPGLGVVVNHRSAEAGISAGTALLFDRQGTLGSASVVGLANADKAVTVGRHSQATTAR
ncbi:acyl-CoA thioesterase domain-containing protein [Sinomonas humi]|uniref:acyl-CoA thioesterase domain-containing protein n=1 Tax=Sinomonas humi TaxID=1338436 RepID=UPI00068C59FF|nr:acyl-CoA thioesterase domain-containing protein [Sinomonas humi]